MRTNLFKYIVFSSLFAAYGCSSEEDNDPFYSEKHPIELGVGIETPTSRAVVTDGQGKTLHAFSSPTNIWLVMKSDYVALSGDNASPNELDFKGNKDTKYCVTYGTTADVVETTKNKVGFDIANLRYWDDIHARSSRLSIWALTVPNKTRTDLWSVANWGTSAPTTDKAWTITSNQTAETVVNEDLCFSNNIAIYASPGSDSRLKFNTEPKGFDTGNLIFYHALTKITVNLVEGKGFDKTINTDFNVDADDPVTLNGSILSGTFDVAEGVFKPYTASAATTTMAKIAKTQEDTSTPGESISKIQFEALVMPGRDLSTTLANAITFGVDKNHFTVSNETLLAKLKESSAVNSDWTTMEAGKNYVFTFIINQTDIKVIATVAEWDELTGSNYSPLINVVQSYGSEGTNFGKGFSLYLSQGTNDEASFDDDFAKGTDVTYSADKYTLDTQLYWPNHQKHYLFRGVWPLVGDTGTPITPTDKVSVKGISVQNVKYAEGTYPSDLMLGYPRIDPEYCPHGKNSAEKGICATQGDIRMNFEYMMSQVEVNLSTSDISNSVVIDDNTIVEIIGGYSEGVILFGTGSSDFTGKSTADYIMSKQDASNKKYLDAIIPQSLESLKFRITVRDNDGKLDKYETVLGIKDIEVTTAGGSKGKISAWESGKKYVYNLYITKTSIKVTATIKDWETVTSDSNHIWM